MYECICNIDTLLFFRQINLTSDDEDELKCMYVFL